MSGRIAFRGPTSAGQSDEGSGVETELGTDETSRRGAGCDPP